MEGKLETGTTDQTRVSSSKGLGPEGICLWVEWSEMVSQSVREAEGLGSPFHLEHPDKRIWKEVDDEHLLPWWLSGQKSVHNSGILVPFWAGNISGEGNGNPLSMH